MRTSPPPSPLVRSRDYTGRGWVFGDERCTYREGCDLPTRTHTHYSHGPEDPFHVVFYDEMELPPGAPCPLCENPRPCVCLGGSDA